VAAARQEGDKQLAPLDRALIRIGEGAALRLLGRPSRGVDAARRAVAALDELTTAERVDTRNLSRLYSQAGMTLYFGGRTTEAISAFAKGVAEAPESAPVEGLSSMAMLAGIHARDGQLGEAKVLVERMRHEPSFARGRDSYSGTYYRIAEAVLALERFDTVAARSHIARSAPNRRAVEHWLAIAETEALVSLVEGDAAGGLASLEAAAGLRGAEGRSAHARQQLARIRGLLHLALGDLDAASAVAHRDPRPGAGAHIERARVALAIGQPGTALKELKVIAGSQLSPRSAAEAASLEIAVLTRYPPRPRLNALTMHLRALLTHSGLRLPLAFLPTEDLHRVLTELSHAGAGELAAEIPGSVLLDALPEVVLTKRELAVLAALPHHASVSEVAHALGVSPNTVKTQLRGVYRKLGAANREDAIALAIGRHLLVPDP
jgi:LuxR family maltose regulon positive regulatory protein